MRLLCLTALSISGYLAWTSFQAGEVYGCSGSQIIDCGHVLHSKYAKVLGLPVSVPAFSLYATLLVVLFYFRKTAPQALLKTGWVMLTVGAVSAAGAAIWFTSLQIADGKYCPYCLGAHSCGLILAIIVLLKSPLQGWSQMRFAGMGVAGVLAMVTLQWQAEAPKTHIVDYYEPVSSTLSGSGEAFAAPGSDGPEEFGAPIAFNAPMEFAPPVFAPPTFAAPGHEEPGHEALGHEEQEHAGALADSSHHSGGLDTDQSHGVSAANQIAALVPPPIDITSPNKPLVEEVDSQQTVPVAKQSDTNALPADVTEEHLVPLEAPAKLAVVESNSAVEYTPAMEVPVIFADSGSEIRPVDFRSEDKTSTEQPDERSTQDGPVVPAASQSDANQSDAGNEPDDEPSQAAITEPAQLHTSREVARPHAVARPRRTVQAVNYLFFSASGATNAAVSEMLLIKSLFADGSGSQEQAADKTTDETKSEKSKVETTAKPAVVKDRVVAVAGNRFSLNPKHWPLIGDPSADLIFVEMFDYTCPHCRVTHKAIEGAFDEYGDRLAIIALPVPFERACNSTVTGMGSPGACEMAKLGVAVWRINRSQFAEYHNYMCENQRTAAEAKVKAEQLVGKEKLAAEIALPYATDYIKKHVELYRRVGQGSVPKLMFPRSTMTGEIQHSSTVVSAIKRELDK